MRVAAIHESKRPLIILTKLSTFTEKDILRYSLRAMEVINYSEFEKNVYRKLSATSDTFAYNSRPRFMGRKLARDTLYHDM